MSIQAVARAWLTGLAMVVALSLPSSDALAQLPAPKDRPLTTEERRQLQRLETDIRRIAQRERASAASLRAIAAATGARLTNDPESVVRTVEARARDLTRLRTALLNAEAHIAALDSSARRQATQDLLNTARDALDAGDFGLADAKLGEVVEAVRSARQAQQAELRTLAIDEAKTLGERAQLALLGNDYDQAAAFFAEAAAVAPEDEVLLRWELLKGQADVLADKGKDLLDAEAAARALTMYRATLPLVSQEAAPEQWAETQIAIAAASSTEGLCQGNQAQLLDAERLLRQVIASTSLQTARGPWSRAQQELGCTPNSLAMFGDAEERHAEALSAFEASLQGRDREQDPLEWSKTQNSIGVVLLNSLQRRPNPELAARAQRALENALEVRKPEIYPMEWAETQLNLASLLHWSWYLDRDPATLEKAVSAIESVDGVYTRELSPRRWADARLTLAGLLSEQGDDPQIFERSRAAFDDAGQVFTIEEDFQGWSASRTGLAQLYARRGEATGAADDLARAVALHREVLGRSAGHASPDDRFRRRRQLLETMSAHAKISEGPQVAGIFASEVAATLAEAEGRHPTAVAMVRVLECDAGLRVGVAENDASLLVASRERCAAVQAASNLPRLYQTMLKMIRGEIALRLADLRPEQKAALQDEAKSLFENVIAADGPESPISQEARAHLNRIVADQA